MNTRRLLMLLLALLLGPGCRSGSKITAPSPDGTEIVIPDRNLVEVPLLHGEETAKAVRLPNLARVKGDFVEVTPDPSMYGRRLVYYHWKAGANAPHEEALWGRMRIKKLAGSTGITLGVIQRSSDFWGREVINVMGVLPIDYEEPLKPITEAAHPPAEEQVAGPPPEVVEEEVAEAPEPTVVVPVPVAPEAPKQPRHVITPSSRATDNNQ